LSAPILQADQRDLAAEAHRADVEVVDRRHDRGFDLREPRIRIHVVQRSEQLFFCVRVARRAIAADADADRARGAALALRLPDRMQNAFLTPSSERSARPRCGSSIGSAY